MRIVFAGTPDFAVESLAALDAAGFSAELVLTRPDKPAGRGKQMQSSPVKRWAQQHGIEVWQPRTLRDEAAQERLRGVGADLMIVAAYGLILPPQVLCTFPRGCLNVHASLLPRWRGAAPIQRAIEAGDTETGICIMQMDEGLDTGPVLLRQSIPIGPRDTARTVHDRLAALGGQLIVQAVRSLAKDGLRPEPQPDQGITYAHKIEAAEGAIDWRLPASVLADRVRAFDPTPGCSFTLCESPSIRIKLWRVAPLASDAPADSAVTPGTVVGIEDGIPRVACGRGQLDLLELQRPGARRMSAAEFLRGSPWRPGQRLC